MSKIRVGYMWVLLVALVLPTGVVVATDQRVIIENGVQAITYAEALAERGEKDAALSTINEAIAYLRGQDGEYAQRLLASALFFKAHVVAGNRSEVVVELLREEEEVLTLLEEAIHLLKGYQDINSEFDVLQAYTLKANILVRQNRVEEAARIYDAINSGYSSHASEEVQLIVGWAGVEQARLWKKEGDLAGAGAAYDRVIRKLVGFNASGDIQILDVLTLAMLGKGVLLSEQGQKVNAIGVFDEIITRVEADNRRYSNNDQFLAVSENVELTYTMAMFNKALGLVELGEVAEAIALCDVILNKHDWSANQKFQMMASEARILKLQVSRSK